MTLRQISAPVSYPIIASAWGYFLQADANPRLPDQTYKPASWDTDLFWEQGREFG